MEINTINVKLIEELEYIIGSECYNPNSYNGYTCEEGCEYRYPVTVTCKDENGERYDKKYRWKLDGISPDDVSRLKYKFGSNHLFIGISIKSALTFLEERYGINFNDMEMKYQEQKNMEEVEKLLRYTPEEFK